MADEDLGFSLDAAPASALWEPEPADVAQVVSAWKAQYVGGYSSTDSGREVADFTADTDPTLAKVQGFIALAVGEIIGRLDVAVPVANYDLARTAATWHAAAAVAAKRSPTSTDETSGMYRSFISNYTASLNDLKAAIRRRIGFPIA